MLIAWPQLNFLTLMPIKNLDYVYQINLHAVYPVDKIHYFLPQSKSNTFTKWFIISDWNSLSTCYLSNTNTERKDVTKNTIFIRSQNSIDEHCRF